MSYQVELTIFIVSCVFVGILFAVLFFYGPIKRFLYSRFTVRMYYKTVKKVTYDNDFYLINKWEYHTNGNPNSAVHINHIIFGDKFIYVIKDCYYSGAIKANANDPSWVYYYAKGKKKYVQNPLIFNKTRTDRLSMASGLDRSFFIPVVLVNDDCMVTPVNSDENTGYIVSLSRFGKFVQTNEKRNDVQPFSPEELSIAVHDLAELNKK